MGAWEKNEHGGFASDTRRELRGMSKPCRLCGRPGMVLTSLGLGILNSSTVHMLYAPKRFGSVRTYL